MPRSGESFRRFLEAMIFQVECVTSWPEALTAIR